MDKPPHTGSMPYREITFSAQDGLKLYARDYGDRSSVLTPVVCLPGLSRNSRDFHDLAMGLADQRRVLTPDYRGRGRSEYAPDPASYTPFIEMLDTLAAIDAAGIEHAVFVGTSRGGLIAMLLGAARPAAIRGVVLNDIGPEIESEGLLRIAGYLVHSPVPENWDHAAAIVKQINGADFTDLSDQDWIAFARRLFRNDDGRPKPDYDPKLATAVSASVTAAGGHAPAFWPQFSSLRPFPVLVVRGENSDVLALETVKKMSRVHDNLAALTVRNRGHAPFLNEPGVESAILQLIAKTDHSRR